MSWRNEITSEQWRVLLAAHLGWLLDGFDVMLYAFALVNIREEFHLTGAMAGALASVTLIASAVGGVVGGVASDRWGRARVLVYSILIYSVFTALTAFSTNVIQLVCWRALVGLGLGAEWSAGSVLIAESWPARHRGKASGLMQSGWALGYAAAATLSVYVIPKYGWRTLFALGVLPALITFWIRRQIPEPPIWRRTKKVDSFAQVLRELNAPQVRERLVIATTLTSLLLFAYWGFFIWMPTYLSSPVAQGGAGFNLTRSLGWVIPVQAGAFLGYVSFGFLADRFGRKPVFIFFVLTSVVIVPLYALSAGRPVLLLLLGPLVGYFGHGYFSLFAAQLAELFDSKIRGSAQGFCYNGGRAVSGLAPMVVGGLADRYGIGSVLSCTSLFYLLGAVVILFLPETKGRVLK